LFGVISVALPLRSGSVVPLFPLSVFLLELPLIRCVEDRIAVLCRVFADSVASKVIAATPAARPGLAGFGLGVARADVDVEGIGVLCLLEGVAEGSTGFSFVSEGIALSEVSLW